MQRYQVMPLRKKRAGSTWNHLEIIFSNLFQQDRRLDIFSFSSHNSWLHFFLDCSPVSVSSLLCVFTCMQTFSFLCLSHLHCRTCNVPHETNAAFHLKSLLIFCLWKNLSMLHAILCSDSISWVSLQKNTLVFSCFLFLQHLLCRHIYQLIDVMA